jgi:hypothetical protein
LPSQPRGDSKSGLISNALACQKCQECERLLGAYRESNAKMVAAGNRLSEAALNWESDSFQRIWDEANAAQLECVRAGKEVFQHMEASHAT